MSVALISRRAAVQTYTEAADALPPEVARLLDPAAGFEREGAWAAFVEHYSKLLLRVAFAFAPGYDGAMDRYAFMLDELRRDDSRRLRQFAADGRGKFSTWLVVVARRLCLDHYRRRYGRPRKGKEEADQSGTVRLVRRRLEDLVGDLNDLSALPDAAATEAADEISLAEGRQALGGAIGELAPRDRLMLTLRFEQELSAREIAGLMGLATPFHVYRRLNRICEGLRERLSGNGSGPRD